MKLGNKRSIFYLFVAMLLSSLVIGSFCKTKFDPVVDDVDSLSSTSKGSIKASSTSNKNASVSDPVYAPVDVEMQPKQVAKNTWYVQGADGMATDNKGFISNAGFVVTSKGVVVFDALGSPSLAWKLVQKIREITHQPIVKVVVSHYHADHIYGIQVFKQLGAEIIAPDGVYDYIDSDGATERLEERRFSLEPWVNDKTVVVTPDKILDKSESFTVGDTRFLVNIIGSAHSAGDLTLYVENDRVLFSGDLIFEGRVPFLGSNNTKHWLETLQKMETNQLHALVPGHGPAATNPKQALTLTREYLAFMRENMAEAVEEMIDFEDAYNRIDWSKYKNMPAFDAANRKNAFQVYLSMENEN
ncbi:MAG TPA: MBL fold metallo-hydrolase [Leucothrix mucor]|nr:MBL fold metallo-hydrolase [Leucothrix mucor]